MTAVVAATTGTVSDILRVLDGDQDPFGLGDLMKPVEGESDRVAIDNVMTSELEASVIATLIDEEEIDDDLVLVPSGEKGKPAVMLENYLPYVGRIVCRLAHAMGYVVRIAVESKLNPYRIPEAVITTPEGLNVQLLAGDRRKIIRESEDPEVTRERYACLEG